MIQNDQMVINAAGKKLVVIVAMNGHMLLDFAGPADVFNSTNKLLESTNDMEGYEILVVSPTADKCVINSVGIEIKCAYSIMDLQTPVDTLLIAGSNNLQYHDDPIYDDFYKWLAAANNCSRRIGSICAGAFALAKAGLLDGRRATTHWDRSNLLQKNYPLIHVDSNPFYVSDGHIYTSGGVSSGIDLALALVEEDYGKAIAIQVARRLVVYLNRPGYQVQFGSLLESGNTYKIADTLQSWIVGRLNEPLDTMRLANQANMSLRNFTRVFTKQTGIPPAKYIEKVRVEATRKYLEDTDLSLETIAEKCGLGSLVSMRRTFLRHLMITPSDYRRAFRSSSVV
jgi:transcriptional regulator GlxA family with amidase domain